MSRFVATVDQRFNPSNVTRFVVTPDKVVGLSEDVYGRVLLAFRAQPNAPVTAVYVTESFDDLSAYLV